jgi:predicted peptidase
MANKYVKIFLVILAASTITIGCGKTEETTQTVVDTVVHTVEYEEEVTTESMNEETISDETINKNNSSPILTDNVTVGTDEYRGFVIDNVLHSDDLGDIHYNVYIPDTYDGTKPYALYFTLPGYEGLYFQGVAQNLKLENFGFEAQKYNDEMIIVALQLEDWGETSANKTIELVEYFIGTYNIDTERVYANGFSGGGETMSIVMGKRPELFTAYLQVSSKWDGEYEPVVKNRTPVYLAIGEKDEYYSSNPTKEAYNTLYSLYKEEGLTDEEIDEILVLDVKDHEYFTERGMSNEHGGGGLFAYDENIMGWLFTR